MGLTKQYKRYGEAERSEELHSGVFNIIGSPNANICYLLYKGLKGKYCVAAACEHVIVWDIRRNEKVCTLIGGKHEVTRICISRDNKQIAVGYTNGSLQFYDLASGNVLFGLHGHKTAITCLNYDKEGMRLVSGSKDTTVVVWDMVDRGGICRLKGHKNIITQAKFMINDNILVTSSADTFVKFWDLDTKHCFKTLIGHRTKIMDFVLLYKDTKIVTGSGDSELRMWDITRRESKDTSSNACKRLKLSDEIKHTSSDDTDANESSDDENDDDDDESPLLLTKRGSIMRQETGSVVSLSTDSTDRVLCCHGNKQVIEAFRINNEQEIKKHANKRWKKLKKQTKEKSEGKDTETTAEDYIMEDYIRNFAKLRMSDKVKSVDLCYIGNDTVKILSLLDNNSIQASDLAIKESQTNDTEALCKVALPGHRQEVRAVAFSSDSTAIMSASFDSVKIWNRASLKCIRTMETQGEKGLCCLFVPGDRHAVVGTMNGNLLILDIASASLLETIEAHNGATVWSLCLAPNEKGLISGGDDQYLRFWDFELVMDEAHSKTSKRLSLIEQRKMKMDQKISAIKFSPDSQHVAVALLDSTVNILFADTLKLKHKLYGHKLPVTCLDISSDGTLIVTGSSDKNIKIWGMDFGDTHKSIFAHDSSIMCIKFIPKTHMFFSGGKDDKIKQWDADSFQHILTLDGHHKDVLDLAVSRSGNFVVSASKDKTLRLWEKKDEILVLDEEREHEREQEYLESMAQSSEHVIAGETNEEVGMAGHQTAETLRSAEKLMEALELHKEETAKIKAHKAECLATKRKLPALPIHPILQAHNVDPDGYVLKVLRDIKSSELEESLLVLPFSYVPGILQLLNHYITSGWSIELCCRCLFFLLKIHQGEITSNNMLLDLLDKLRHSTTTAVAGVKDTIGFNLAGLRFIQQQIEQKEEVIFFEDATKKQKQKNRKKRKAVLAFKT